MKRRDTAKGLLLAAAGFLASGVVGCMGSSDGGPQGPNSPSPAASPGGPGGGGSGSGGSPGSGSGGSPGGVVGGGAGDPGANGTIPAGPCEVRLPPRLILLSDYQNLNSLRTLLGKGAVSEVDAAENTQQTKPFTQKGVVVNASLVHQRMAWADGAAVNFATRFAEVTGCNASRVDDACARTFLSSFATRAFRRPVASEELTDVMAVYNVGKTTSFTNGVKRAVEAILGAPSFLYRRELGTADDKGGLTLSPHEIASELSFLLTDAPPDADLMKAADSGALAKDDEIARQVERLIAKPEVQDALSSTLISAWGLSNLFGTAKDPKLFPEYNPALQAAMFHETELFVRDVLWTRKAPLAELLTSKKGFVNAALAGIYGVPFTGKTGEYVEVTLPGQRSGLLTQASVMATLARTDSTSVVARGLFVRGAMLCLGKLPSPPEELSGDIQELLKADMTERERADVRKMNAKCGGCHAGIDPFGLLLEQYDPLGKFRTTLKNKPIDASSEVNAGSISGKFSDALAFAKAAAESPEFSACVSRQYLAYATQDEELKASDCNVAALGRDVEEMTMPALIKAVAASPALRQRKKEAP